MLELQVGRDGRLLLVVVHLLLLLLLGGLLGEVGLRARTQCIQPKVCRGKSERDQNTVSGGVSDSPR